MPVDAATTVVTGSRSAPSQRRTVGGGGSPHSPRPPPRPSPPTTPPTRPKARHTQPSRLVRRSQTPPISLFIEEVGIELFDSPTASPQLPHHQNGNSSGGRGGGHFFTIQSSALGPSTGGSIPSSAHSPGSPRGRSSGQHRPALTTPPTSPPWSNALSSTTTNGLSPSSITSATVANQYAPSLLGRGREESGPLSVVLSSGDESLEMSAASDEGEESSRGEESGAEDCDGLRLSALEKDYPGNRFTEAVLAFSRDLPASSYMCIETHLRFSRYLRDMKSTVDLSRELNLLYQKRACLATEDKVLLFRTVAGIYEGAGLRRKEAMFTHFAGIQAFEAGMTDGIKDHFVQSHELLMRSLEGYQRCFQSGKNEEQHHSWNRIQATILRDLVLLANRFEEFELVKRHSCQLLQGLYRHLPKQDLEKVIGILSNVQHRDPAPGRRRSSLIPVSPQGTTLPLREVPRVKSFEAQDLTAELHPHRRHGYTPPPSPSSGPFIVSSLAAHRRPEIREVLWVAHTSVYVTVVISNPLPFQVQVEDLRLWVDASDPAPVAMRTTQSSLQLPPGGDPVQFNLVAIPEGSGDLRIRGYQARVFGVASQCEVDVMSGMKITVLPCLPVMRLRVKYCDSSLCPDQLPEQQPSLGPLEIYDGENCILVVAMENGRESSITELAVGLEGSSKDDVIQFEWSPGKISLPRPIPSDSAHHIHIKMAAALPAATRVPDDSSGIDGMNPSEIAVLSTTTMGRRLSALDLPADKGKFFSMVKKRLKRNSLKRQSPQQSSLYPLQSGKSSTMTRGWRTTAPSVLHKKTSLPEGPPTPPKSPTPPTQRRNATAHPSLSQLSLVQDRGSRPATPTSLSSGCGSETTDGTSLTSTTAYPTSRDFIGVAMPTRGGSARYHSLLDVPMPPEYQDLSYFLWAEYSGGAGSEDGYFRRTTLDLKVRLRPAFLFCRFDVTASRQSPAHFDLLFTAVNASAEHRLQLHLEIEEGICSKGQTLQRMWEVEPGGHKPVTLSLKRFDIPEQGNGEATSMASYCQHISSALTLTWSCHGNKRQGSTSLQGFSLTPDCLECIRPTAVDIKLSVNRVSIEDGRQLKIVSGRPLPVSLIVQNNTESTMAGAELEVRPYSEGVCLEDVLIHTSSLRTTAPEIPPHQSFTHHCTLVFLYSGTYQLQGLCHVPRTLSPPPTHGGSPAPWGSIVGVRSRVPDHLDVTELYSLTESTLQSITGPSEAVHKRRPLGKNKRSPSKEVAMATQLSAAANVLQNLPAGKEVPKRTYSGPNLELECVFIPQ